MKRQTIKSILELQRPLSQHFKTVTHEEVPRTLRWFDDQRLENSWCLTMEEQLTLLNNVSSSLYEDWFVQIESGAIPVLSDDMVHRLSILVGIHKALEILAPDNRPDYALRWFLTPNDSASYAGRSIKAYLLANNTLEGFRTVEAYLVDAVNGFLGGAYS